MDQLRQRLKDGCASTDKRGGAGDLESTLDSDVVKALMKTAAQKVSPSRYAACTPELKYWLRTFFKSQAELRAAAIKASAVEAEAAAERAGAGALKTPESERLWRLSTLLNANRKEGCLSGPTAGGAIQRGPSAEDALHAARVVQERIRVIACAAQAAEAEQLTQSSRASAKDLQAGEARINLDGWKKQLSAEGYAASSPELQEQLKRLVESQTELRAAAIEYLAMVLTW